MTEEYTFDTDTYNKLYRRFISDSKTENLVKMGHFKGKVVMDICAGNGRLSEKVMDLGAKNVIPIDINKNVLATGRGKPYQFMIWPLNMSVEQVAFEGVWFAERIVSVMYCQQAVNYWFNQNTLKKLVERYGMHDLEFCFNTFNKKPSSAPQSKSYEIDGVKYLETWYVVPENGTEMVYHLQCCEGMKPHLTKFRWIDEKEYRDALSMSFKEVHEIREGDTSIWVARNPIKW